MPYWLEVALWAVAALIGGAIILTPIGALFYALFGYMEGTTKLDETRHQLRMERIRAGLSPDGSGRRLNR
ncbi:hypothetical protein [Micromonospora sp. NPDC049891]|uniref:hypothetical protein n=1 Tax=Micromonospora sp. NPDC049891 TaxID=3155655 RepID=UPI0033D8FB92